MKDFKISSNKGNATYYVMAVIMVITIMVSGLLYVSLRSSIVTSNYTNDISDYNECESALMKIKGELKATLVGESIISLDQDIEVQNWCKDGRGKKYFAVGLNTLSYHFPISYNSDINNEIITINKILGYDGIAEQSVLIKGNVFDGSNSGFEVTYVGEGNYFFIENITVQSGSVGIETDIKICIGSENKISDVVFSGYRVFNVAEGGEG